MMVAWATHPYHQNQKEEMKMTFEQSIPRTWPIGSDIYTVIRTKGCIAIHSLYKDTLGSRLSPGTRAVLFYSSERKVIGIKPINDQSEYSPIKISGESEHPLICCKPFLDHYQIPHRYNSDVHHALWNHEGGCVPRPTKLRLAPIKITQPASRVIFVNIGPRQFGRISLNMM